MASPQLHIRDIIGRTPGDWPTENEDNGNYRIVCKGCGAVVSGPKRAYHCYTCHEANKAEWEALPLEEQERRMTEAIVFVKSHF